VFACFRDAGVFYQPFIFLSHIRAGWKDIPCLNSEPLASISLGEFGSYEKSSGSVCGLRGFDEGVYF
jgi:hypothetical protein